MKKKTNAWSREAREKRNAAKLEKKEMLDKLG